MTRFSVPTGIAPGRSLRFWLVAVFLLAGAPVRAAEPVPPGVCRGEPLRILLQPTAEARGASGSGVMIPAYSPTGIAVSEQGHMIYDLELTFGGLGGGPSAGGHYIAWVAEPNLSKIIKLGEISNGTKRYDAIGLNKFILLVTLEQSAAVTERKGPIVLRGISPSGLLQSFVGHDLFGGGGPC